MKTETIQTPDGCNLVFDVLEGENKGFLLVHGLASNARLWDGLAEQLNVSGHQVAIVDQRGHGRSGKPDTGYDFATITSDLAQIADFLSKKYNFEIFSLWVLTMVGEVSPEPIIVRIRGELVMKIFHL